MQIFFFWQVQTVLALKTSPYLTELQGLTALLEHYQKTTEYIYM